MKTAELISEARQLARELNADSRLSNKAIWSIIDKARLWIIRRESDKMKLIRHESLFQTIKCVLVEEAPVIDPCCGIRSRCKIFRTRIKLPELFEDVEGVIIKAVFSIDGSTEFTPIKISEYTRKLDSPENKYDKGEYYFYNNGYLYFPKNPIRMVMVKGYFKHEVETNGDCQECKDKPCKSRLEEEAYLPDDLRGELMEYVKKDLMMYKQIRPDIDINKKEEV